MYNNTECAKSQSCSQLLKVDYGQKLLSICTVVSDIIQAYSVRLDSCTVFLFTLLISLDNLVVINQIL